MDDVVLQPYDLRWPIRFEEEREWLCNILPGAQIIDIAHFGSTAIAGLDADPVIDIVVAVASLSAARLLCTKILVGFGYRAADHPISADALFFEKAPPSAPARTHHVHLTEPEGVMWEQVAFRDYLRTHGDDAARYLARKRALVAAHAGDRTSYVRAKSGFVAEIMARANAEGYLAPMLR